MQVQVVQEHLKQALQVVSRVVGNRSTLPVLANILISTDKNRLKISATNLEIGINFWVGCKVEHEGSVTVPAKLLSEFVANLPNENITLNVEDNKLSIDAGQYQSTINGISPEEFPSIPVVSDSSPMLVGGSDLEKAITQTISAVSSDEARPVLTGTYIYNDDSSIILVATDSYRLAEKRIKLDTKPKEIKMIIPGRTMQEVLRVVAGVKDNVEIHIEDAQIMFRVGEIEIISRIIDGQFPDYKQLIPAENEINLSIEKKEFINITKISSLFARENGGSITLNVDDNKQEMSIQSIASQVGDNTSRAKATVEGAGEVAINSRYIIDALNVIDQEKVTFAFSGKLNPCVLKPVNDDSYLHIIMPLRS